MGSSILTPGSFDLIDAFAGQLNAKPAHELGKRYECIRLAINLSNPSFLILLVPSLRVGFPKHVILRSAFLGYLDQPLQKIISGLRFH